MTLERPLNAITYGRSGAGKSLAAIRAFPTGLFAGPANAFLPAKNYLDIDLGQRVIDCTTITKATLLLEKNHEKAPAFIFDDCTIAADKEVLEIQKIMSGWAVFDELLKRTLRFFDVAREAKCHVITIWHESDPREIKTKGLNKHVPGGPSVQGWKLPEKLPGLTDFVARVVWQDSPLWPWQYQTGPDENYPTKDRMSIAPPLFPLNLGELVRAGGYEVPRLKSMPWFETTVENIAGAIAEDGTKPPEQQDIKAVLTKCAGLAMEVSKNQRHARWALQDGYDRAMLRHARSNILTDFLNNIATRKEDALA